MRIAIRDYLVYLVVRILICGVQAIRIETCEMLAGRMASLFFHVLRVRRGVVDENLRHAFPRMTDRQRARLAWRMWKHLFLMVAEMAHSRRKIHDTNWRHYISLRNSRELVQRLLDDRPAVLVSGHFGNFEIGGYVLGILGMPTFTVARPLDNRYLDRFLNDFRGAEGQQILSKHGSSEEIGRLLESSGSLLVLGDQSAGPKGSWVDFFGRPASVHRAIALFSLSHDAPLVVCFSRRLGEALHFEVGAEAVLDPREGGAAASGIKELSAWFTNQLETAIRRAPDQYWWVHRRWKDQRAAHRAHRRNRAA